ncbi:MAG: TolC family protein [Oligoflexia bacterium]|nr:TolC family protein [Oligoflexia bacterium]
MWKIHEMTKISVLLSPLILILNFTLNHYSNAHASENVITLDDYLKQVQNSNHGFKAAAQSSRALELKSQEGELLFAPAAFATTQFVNDEKLNSSPTSQGTKTFVDSYSFGVSKQFEMGLQSKLSYMMNYYSIEGASPMFLKTPKFYESKTALDLSFPLLRNFLAKETKATTSVMKSQTMANYYVERYKMKALMLEAELSYWRLVLARETVKVQKDLLSKSEKIYNWNKERYLKQLADKSDFLRSEAEVQARKIELQMAVDEEMAGIRQFNTTRGTDASEESDVLAEALMVLDGSGSVDVKNLYIPGFSESELREDVKAAEQQKFLVEANAQGGIERNRPALDLFGQVALNGRDRELGKSTSQAMDREYPTLTVGVKFSMPLSLGVMKDVRKGFSIDRYAAESVYSKKLSDLKQEWFELQKKHVEAQKRLSLVNALESAQDAKIKFERDQLLRGRTTTYQVLLFEQERAAVRLSRIRVKSEILSLVAKMKLFGKLQVAALE